MARSKRPGVHETSCVSPGAALGEGVTIGPFAVVNEGVELGEGAYVGPHCVLGEPTAGFYDGGDYEPRPCRIGARAVIRSHSIVYDGATIGHDFATGHHVNVREGTTIGDDVRVGTLSDLQGNLTIGDHVRLHSSVFVPAGSVIEDFAWLFPHVVVTNDPHPPSDTCTVGATIRRFAAVGADATIMPGVEIGAGALIGAKALVREDVPPAAVAVGVPARIVGTTTDVPCRHGHLEQVYPWWSHFRRGYPDGVLPEPEQTLADVGITPDVALPRRPGGGSR